MAHLSDVPRPSMQPLTIFCETFATLTATPARLAMVALFEAFLCSSWFTAGEGASLAVLAFLLAMALYAFENSDEGRTALQVLTAQAEQTNAKLAATTNQRDRAVHRLRQCVVGFRQRDAMIQQLRDHRTVVDAACWRVAHVAKREAAAHGHTKATLKDSARREAKAIINYEALCTSMKHELDEAKRMLKNRDEELANEKKRTKEHQESSEKHESFKIAFLSHQILQGTGASPPPIPVSTVACRQTPVAPAQ
ncbi:hypothetical protein C2E23DRAFT_883521 [Lenzites betulinus]|nr:hypothetical protein C2E23DRAFT_883521 [Lenzites betulinus]